MGAEIVEDDDVSRMKGGNERLLDVSREASAVDRAIEHKRRFDAIAPQSRDEGERLPMSVRRFGDQALAFRPPTGQRRHVGLDPCLVDEDVPNRPQRPVLRAGGPQSRQTGLRGRIPCLSGKSRDIL